MLKSYCENTTPESLQNIGLLNISHGNNVNKKQVFLEEIVQFIKLVEKDFIAFRKVPEMICINKFTWMNQFEA